ncbi:MAG: hypothetical protein C4294_13085, partial [Nitrospiraceae bacterium]
MASRVVMPKLTDTMEEGTVLKWKKHEGDHVESGDVLAEIETDKATMEWESPEDGTLTDLDRAIDVLVEMKNISEVAVGLAYSALVLRDTWLAAEVNHLEDRLDEMKERLEVWVLRSAH